MGVIIDGMLIAGGLKRVEYLRLFKPSKHLIHKLVHFAVEIGLLEYSSSPSSAIEQDVVDTTTMTATYGGGSSRRKSTGVIMAATKRMIRKMNPRQRFKVRMDDTLVNSRVPVVQ